MPSILDSEYTLCYFMGIYKSRPTNQIVSDQWNSKVCENYMQLKRKINEDIHYRPDTGWSQFHTACYEGNADEVRRLVTQATINSLTENEGLTPLHIASQRDRYDVVRILLENCADISVFSTNGFTPLHMAAYKGDCILLTQLLGKNPELINLHSLYEEASPLQIACVQGHYKAVMFLLNHNANIQKEDIAKFTPFHIACYFGHTEIAELLLEYGADVNQEAESNESPLHLACYKNNSDLALLLITKYNANINATDNERHLCLHYASRLGMVIVIEALLKSEQNITPHAANVYGDTALHFACYNGRLDSTKALLNLSGDHSLTAENLFSETPFHSACTNGTNIELINFLMDHPKVDINIQGKDGHTALHSACYHGNAAVVQLLLERGANAHLLARSRDSDQLFEESPMMWAYEKGYDEVVTILKHKARPPVEDSGSIEYSPSSSDSSEFYQLGVPSPIGKIRSMTKEKADIMQLRDTLDKKYQININDIENEGPVGCGSFGKVYKGRCKNEDVAIKKYRVSALSSKSDIDLFCREVSILCEVDHPNVIKFVGACLDEPSQFAILTDFAEGGSLYHLLHEQKRVLDITIRCSISTDVARGMAYLHNLPNPIMHRDLNSHNILLNKDGRALIADFGESRFLKSPNEDNLTKQPGNLRWMAPEIFTQSTKYSIKADMFSFALCLWEIFTGELPLRELKPAAAAADMYFRSTRPEIPPTFPKLLVNIIQNGWALNPEERPTFQEVLGNLEAILQAIKTSPNSFNIQYSRSSQLSPYLGATRRSHYEDNNNDLSNLNLDKASLTRSNDSAYVADPLSTKCITQTKFD